MAGEHLSEEQKEHARDLARKLREKIALYFFEPPQDERIAELRAIRDELEGMGFIVTHKAGVNLKTMTSEVEVSLYFSREPPNNVIHLSSRKKSP